MYIRVMKVAIPEETKQLIQDLALRGDNSAISGIIAGKHKKEAGYDLYRFEVRNTLKRGSGEEKIVKAICEFYAARHASNQKLSVPENVSS